MLRFSLMMLSSICSIGNFIWTIVSLWLQEDLRKIDNWQYINCVNLWVRFLCCNYKDYNLHPLFSQVLQVLRGVAHLFPGTRYLPLRLKLAQMLNELSTCSQMFFPIPSLLFDCLEFREISQKEQTQKTKVNFLSLLKVRHLYWTIWMITIRNFYVLLCMFWNHKNVRLLLYEVAMQCFLCVTTYKCIDMKFVYLENGLD